MLQRIFWEMFLPSMMWYWRNPWSWKLLGILSDRPQASKIVLEHCKNKDTYFENKELKKLVLSRGKTEMMKIFKIENEQTENELFKKIPKTAEFAYYGVMSHKIIPIIKNHGTVQKVVVLFNRTMQIIII